MLCKGLFSFNNADLFHRMLHESHWHTADVEDIICVKHGFEILLSHERFHELINIFVKGVVVSTVFRLMVSFLNAF